MGEVKGNNIYIDKGGGKTAKEELNKREERERDGVPEGGGRTESSAWCLIAGFVVKNIRESRWAWSPRPHAALHGSGHYTRG